MLNKILCNLDNIDITIKDMPLSIKNLIDEEEQKYISELNKEELKYETMLIKNNTSLTPLKKSNKEKKIQKLKNQSVLKGWNNMKKVEYDDELQEDINVLKYRNEINKKVKYKKGITENPNFFQIGYTIDNKNNINNNSKKIKKRILDQFLELDSQLNHTKNKFKKIQNEKMKNGKNRKWIKLKRDQLKKENKFKAGNTTDIY